MSHLTQLDRIERDLADLAILVRAVLHGEKILMLDLTKLTQTVKDTLDAEQAATLAFTQIAAALKQTDGDQAAVNALADQLAAGAANLGSAVVAGTPADPNTLPVVP